MATKPNPFNKFLNLLVLVVLGYAVFTTYISPTHKKAGAPAGSESLHDTQTGDSASGFEEWSKILGVMGNSIQPVLKTVSETKGSGSSVLCGQQITYQYTDKILGDAEPFLKDEKISLRLGSMPLIEGHRRALADMKAGAEKTVQFSSRWGYVDSGPQNARGKDIESHIKLISTSPLAPVFTMPIRVFYNKPHLLANETFACGAALKAKFKFWSVDGTLLYPADKKEPDWVNVTIGLGQAPLGVEAVLQQLSRGESTTAILPHESLVFFNPEKDAPDSQKPFRGIAFPKNQAILVDIEVADDISSAKAKPAETVPEIPASAPTLSKP